MALALCRKNLTAYHTCVMNLFSILICLKFFYECIFITTMDNRRFEELTRQTRSTNGLQPQSQGYTIMLLSYLKCVLFNKSSISQSSIKAINALRQPLCQRTPACRCWFTYYASPKLTSGYFIGSNFGK